MDELARKIVEGQRRDQSRIASVEGYLVTVDVADYEVVIGELITAGDASGVVIGLAGRRMAQVFFPAASRLRPGQAAQPTGTGARLQRVKNTARLAECAFVEDQDPQGVDFWKRTQRPDALDVRTTGIPRVDRYLPCARGGIHVVFSLDPPSQPWQRLLPEGSIVVLTDREEVLTDDAVRVIVDETPAAARAGVMVAVSLARDGPSTLVIDLKASAAHPLLSTDLIREMAARWTGPEEIWLGLRLDPGTFDICESLLPGEVDVHFVMGPDGTIDSLRSASRLADPSTVIDRNNWSQGAELEEYVNIFGADDLEEDHTALLDFARARYLDINSR